MNGATVVSAIEHAAVMGPDGSFGVRTVLAVSAGRFAAEPAATGEVLDGTGLWVIPGVYDCHSHLSWSDFHAADRARRTPAERTALTTAALERTLHVGVVAVRDAGGASAELRDAIAAGTVHGPRLQVSVDMLGPETAGDADRVRAAVDTALGRGAQWIKLIATESIGSPAGSELGSHFTDGEFRIAVERAAAGGARVMVHAWGGRAISAAVDAGVASIEHGIFLTRQQAHLAEAAGVVFVPTLAVYEDVQRMVAAGALPGVAPQRIAEVIAAHRIAVGHAADAGLPIALGSDAGTARQHGRNLSEIAALMRAGMGSASALLAATANGAALLGGRAGGTAGHGGTLAQGELADAVLLAADPADPATFADPGAVVGVVTAGAIVHLDLAVPHRPQQKPNTTP